MVFHILSIIFMKKYEEMCPFCEISTESKLVYAKSVWLKTDVLS